MSHVALSHSAEVKPRCASGSVSKSPYARLKLACIVTGCPGTVWAGLTEDGRILTLHVLDLQDEGEWVAIIKNRYESLLIEIFDYPESATPTAKDTTP